MWFSDLHNELSFLLPTIDIGLYPSYRSSLNAYFIKHFLRTWRESDMIFLFLAVHKMTCSARTASRNARKSKLFSYVFQMQESVPYTPTQN